MEPLPCAGASGRARACLALALAAAAAILLVAGIHARRGFLVGFYVPAPAAGAGPSPGDLVPGLIRIDYGNPRLEGITQIGIEPGVHHVFAPAPIFADRSIRWVGELSIETPGRYGFELDSDDGSELLLDERPVISSWCDHDTVTRSAWVELSQGFHRVRIDYYQRGAGASIAWRWRPPGGTTESVPPRALWHVKPGAIGEPYLNATPDVPGRQAAGTAIALGTGVTGTGTPAPGPGPGAGPGAGPGPGSGPPGVDAVAAAALTTAPAGLVPGVLVGSYLLSADPRLLFDLRVREVPSSPEPVPPERAGDCQASVAGAWSLCPLAYRLEAYAQVSRAGPVVFNVAPGVIASMAVDGQVRGAADSTTPPSSSPAPAPAPAPTPAPTRPPAPDRAPSPAGAPPPIPTSLQTVDLAAGVHHFCILAFVPGGALRPGLSVMAGPTAPGGTAPAASAAASAAESGGPRVLVPTGLVDRLVGAIAPDRLLCQRRERAVDLPADVDTLVPYLCEWDIARFGHPAQRPAVRTLWEGDLHIKTPGQYLFELAGTGLAALELAAGVPPLIKGPAAATARQIVALAAGTYAARLTSDDPGPVHALTARWGTGLADLEPLGRDVGVPGRGGGFLALIVLAAAALAGLSAWVAHGSGGLDATARALVGPPSPDRARRVATGLLALAIVLLGLALRLHDYEATPVPMECADEMNHHFAGHQLLHGEALIGWEWRHVYRHEWNVQFHGTMLELAEPFLFYPPVFTGLVGAVNWLGGARDLFETRLSVTRLLPIGLQTATLALLLPLGTALGLARPAILMGMLWYAVDPVAVVAGRLVKEESLVALLFVLLALAVCRHRRSPSWSGRAWMGALIVTAIGTKQTAVALPAFAVVALLWARQRRAALAVAMYAVAGLLLYVLWAARQDLLVFVRLQAALALYADQLGALLPLLSQARALERDLVHAWLLGLWVLFFMAAARGRQPVLTSAVLTYTAVLAAAIPSGRNFGWYRLPLYPMLSLALGQETWRMIACADPVGALVWVGLMALPALQTIGSLPALHPTVVLRIGYSVCLAVLLARAVHWRPLRLAVGLVLAVLVAGVVLAALWVTLTVRTILPPLQPVDPTGWVSVPLDKTTGHPSGGQLPEDWREFSRANPSLAARLGPP